MLSFMMWKLKISEGGRNVRTCNGHIGRETWEFDEQFGTNDERAFVERAREEFHANRFNNKQSSDLLARMQIAKENNINIMSKTSKSEKTISEALRNAINYLSAIQAKSGHWPGDLPGPLFLTPTLIIVLYVTESLHVLSSEHFKELCRYMYNHQNRDGGWGIHAEGPSCMICTALNYTALRLLGEEAENEKLYEARIWIHDHGGVTMIPSWGKIWLSILGAYKWSGVNPTPPELFSLPSFFPIHPGKFWCHVRLIIIPMSYLYGKKFVGPITETIRSLRNELYTEPYENINWSEARKLCSKEDRYIQHLRFHDYLCDFLYKIYQPLFSSWPLSLVRNRALKAIENYLQNEAENSRYICVGSLQKSLCMLSSWVQDPNSENFKLHLERVHDYLWVGEDGMKMKASSSQLWDAAFAVQAILACDFVKDYGKTLKKAHQFIKDSQIIENPYGDFQGHFRHFSKGGWGFATVDQGWPVSDCSAEALKALLLLSDISPEIVGEKLSNERMYDGINFLISLQNPNGGFSTWELSRTYPWVEVFNLSEMFADVMVDYQYVECTSSSIQALVLFKERYPTIRRAEIEKSIQNAIKFIENAQNDDGSWYGSWGVCYTYGTWFGIEGLIAAGKTYENCKNIRKACNFLLSKQLDDGGWGESYLSSTKKEYVYLEGKKSNLVQTSWAMLGLLKAGQFERNSDPLNRAANYLIHTQLENGDFPQQEMIGNFLKNGLLNYMAYRNIFPIWTLGEYHKKTIHSKTN